MSCLLPLSRRQRQQQQQQQQSSVTSCRTRSRFVRLAVPNAAFAHGVLAPWQAHGSGAVCTRPIRRRLAWAQCVGDYAAVLGAGAVLRQTLPLQYSRRNAYKLTMCDGARVGGSAVGVAYRRRIFVRLRAGDNGEHIVAERTGILVTQAGGSHVLFVDADDGAAHDGERITIEVGVECDDDTGSGTSAVDYYHYHYDNNYYGNYCAGGDNGGTTAEHYFGRVPIAAVRLYAQRVTRRTTTTTTTTTVAGARPPAIGDAGAVVPGVPDTAADTDEATAVVHADERPARPARPPPPPKPTVHFAEPLRVESSSSADHYRRHRRQRRRRRRHRRE